MKIIIKKIIPLISLSTFVLLLNVSSDAEIYKWTDVNGQTHYTATPPPVQQKKKSVKATDIEDKIRAAAGKYRAPVKTAKLDSDVEELTESKAEELAGPNKELIKYCTTQRNNLAQLKKNYRSVWVDTKGKRTKLDQQQRKQKVEYLKTKIKEDCAGVKT